MSYLYGAMLQGNPYKVLATRTRKRFRATAVGIQPIETVDPETGEIRQATQLIGSQKVYDSTDFIKFYEPLILTKLTLAGVKVFSYIVSALQYGGYVAFNYEDCMSFTGYTSRKAVCAGLNDLKENDVIRKKSFGEWWVNPNIVYRGQRDEIYAVVD